jgi:DNA adenine methylase
MSTLTLPLKWHGGKRYLARRIIALMPRHLHYVEPYAGGPAVLLARDPNDPRLWMPGHEGVSEVVNDLDGTLTTFWRVLKDPATFEAFRRRVEAVPLSENEWREARDRLARRPEADPVDRAVWFFVYNRQSRAGEMKSFTPVTRKRTRRRMNGNVSEWLGAVDGLPAVHARLRQVFILNRPALDVIRQEDTPETLFYCDPPYLHETRASTAAYSHEMTEEDHRRLLDVLLCVKSKVMLSGYPSDLYDRALAGWKRHEFDVPNNAAGGKAKRRMLECVWCNFPPAAAGNHNAPWA